MCLDICSCHLIHYHKEGDKFLQWIVTGNKTWVHNCQPETKLRSMQQKQPSSPVEEIQDATINRQGDVDHLLGFLRAYS
jgi:hypothetical protein